MKLRDEHFTIAGRGCGKTIQNTIKEYENALKKAMMEGKWEEYYRMKKLFKGKKA